MSDQQYIDLCHRVIDEGVWVLNGRTGKRCLTVINADLQYDCSEGYLPILTTKKVNWKKAIAELLGYIQGVSNAADMRKLGTDTWDENSNVDRWQRSPYCKGPDDMGRVYGVQGRKWRDHEYNIDIDQLKKIYMNLLNNVDDRGEILTYWNVAELDKGCLRPCLYEHIFSLLDGKLYINSIQRSDDIPLGHAFNQIQVAVFLMIMAQITGHKAATGFHKVINAHIYEDQLETLKTQLDNPIYDPPKLFITPRLQTLDDLMTATVEDFQVIDYQSGPYIPFKFSV